MAEAKIISRYENEVPLNKILFAKGADDVIIPSKRDGDAGFDIYAHFDEDYIVI